VAVAGLDAHIGGAPAEVFSPQVEQMQIDLGMVSLSTIVSVYRCLCVPFGGGERKRERERERMCVSEREKMRESVYIYTHTQVCCL